MKKELYITLLLFSLTTPLFAQSGIDDVLKSIETNNKALQAGQHLNESQKA